ncbi:hypothetical protein [Paraburkholderia sacchari]|uniref:hypothetical protein n=1 Tax=Paraburkholderia sacchari TaxID=159450 RepID=UPI001BD19393|nr:hypothetical protein [Paraburkholderia sacchari]
MVTLVPAVIRRRPAMAGAHQHQGKRTTHHDRLGTWVRVKVWVRLEAILCPPWSNSVERKGQAKGAVKWVVS